MTLSRRAALAGLTTLTGCAHIAPPPATLPEALAASIGDGLDGLIVHVDRRGHAPQSHAAGWKDAWQRVPAEPQALFKIASISKLYIAAAAARLVAGGQLSLDRTLADYLPATAPDIPNADRITLRQLLQHRSGIFNFTDSRRFPWFDPPQDLAGHLVWVRGQPAAFEPGARHRYSNTNYLLIGAILDRVLGRSHHRYIDEALLMPLGLRQTFHRSSEVHPSRLVSGRHPAHAGDLKAVDHAAPGGSMVASAQDVAVFLRALNDGSLLPPDEQALYTRLYVLEHTGLLPGYMSIARHQHDLDAVIVLFASSSGAPGWHVAESAYARVVRALRNA